jgi:alpha,alpha-trehalase
MTHVKAFYRNNDVKSYDKERFYDKVTDCLTPLFFRADRAMRASGFDPSNRFGPFTAGFWITLLFV